MNRRSIQKISLSDQERQLILRAVKYLSDLRVVATVYLQSSKRIYREESIFHAKRLHRILRCLDRLLTNAKTNASQRYGWPDSRLSFAIESLEGWFISPNAWGEETVAISSMYLYELQCSLCEALGDRSRRRWKFSSEEWAVQPDRIRWQPYTPAHSFNPKRVQENTELTRSISVVGDIRRSEDLLTYGPHPVTYAERIVEFMALTRSIVLKHGGIYDKFTGDGFLAHFNEGLLRENHGEFDVSFINFVLEIHSVCETFISEWTKSLRRLPDRKIGLAIGADIGHVRIFEVEGHLVAVGEPVLWAQRMSQIAGAGEVIVNNILKNQLETWMDPLIPRIHELKSGEVCTGFVLPNK